MIVRDGGQGAGGTFLELRCPGPPQLPERALGGLTVPPGTSRRRRRLPSSQEPTWRSRTHSRRSHRSPPRCSSPGPSPPLALGTKARLFSVAHNALSNAFLHAQAGRVEVRLDFGAARIRLSVSDDGVGLPDDYEERGRGFRGMRADAGRLGGRLIVETGGRGGGTTVTCEIPCE